MSGESAAPIIRERIAKVNSAQCEYPNWLSRQKSRRDNVVWRDNGSTHRIYLTLFLVGR